MMKKEEFDGGSWIPWAVLSVVLSLAGWRVGFIVSDAIDPPPAVEQGKVSRVYPKPEGRQELFIFTASGRWVFPTVSLPPDGSPFVVGEAVQVERKGSGEIAISPVVE